MYGLAAIEQANGWAMAGAGACIVLTGLTVLSFLISTIPRITGMFEKKTPPAEEPQKEARPTEPAQADHQMDDIVAQSQQIMEEAQDLGADFTLIELHQRIKALGIVDPHRLVNRLKEDGLLISIGDGNFTWQTQSDE